MKLLLLLVPIILSGCISDEGINNYNEAYDNCASSASKATKDGVSYANCMNRSGWPLFEASGN